MSFRFDNDVVRLYPACICIHHGSEHGPDGCLHVNFRYGDREEGVDVVICSCKWVPQGLRRDVRGTTTSRYRW